MEIHKVQMQILRELLFKPNSRFRDLNVADLTNDHLSYHLRTLLELQLVEKSDDGYILTTTGKEYANRMDTEDKKIERQPKVSVLLVVEDDSQNEKRFAIQTRLKEPYYGYKGFMTGKIRFGEKVTEAAARELKEEMGLQASYEPIIILHEIVYDKQQNLLEDKFFHIVRCYDIQGELLEQHEGGTNQWLTEKELQQATPVFHNELEIYNWYKNGYRGFKEEVYYVDSF